MQKIKGYLRRTLGRIWRCVEVGMELRPRRRRGRTDSRNGLCSLVVPLKRLVGTPTARTSLDPRVLLAQHWCPRGQERLMTPEEVSLTEERNKEAWEGSLLS